MNSSADADPLPEDVSSDVLVVGYGPVGMTCAALLAHYGLDVVAIEHFEYHDQDQDIPGLQHAYFVADPERPHDVGRYGGRRNYRVEFAAKPDETREYRDWKAGL